MYGRAISKLRGVLKSKGLKSDEASLENNSYDLYHFHIEAFDNKIQMNKFKVAKTKVGEVDVKDNVFGFDGDNSFLESVQSNS